MSHRSFSERPSAATVMSFTAGALELEHGAWVTYA
jgi:hypothetical protein